jgi:hypothetical protein
MDDKAYMKTINDGRQAGESNDHASPRLVRGGMGGGLTYMDLDAKVRDLYPIIVPMGGRYRAAGAFTISERPVGRVLAAPQELASSAKASNLGHSLV